MIIVNADDWGRSRAETDAALRCYTSGRITSATAMVWMADSERAAELALRAGIEVGLHLNFTEPFDASGVDPALRAAQDRVCRFLRSSRYARLVFHPLRHADFRASYQAQAREFERLYGRAPTHVDGHHHQHLCSNVLLGAVIPEGAKLRRHFHFLPGEKTPANRGYRALADRMLARRYRLADFFFALSQCDARRLARVLELAREHRVELMTHPVRPAEESVLMDEHFGGALSQLVCASYRLV